MPRRRNKKSIRTVRPAPKSSFLSNFKLSALRFPAPRWHVIRQSAIGLAWLALASGIVLAWMLGVPQLQAFAAQRNSVDPRQITMHVRVTF